jgi:uncharacterized protein (DUF1778 family)
VPRTYLKRPRREPLKLTLDPDDAQRLRDVAASCGQSADDFVLGLVRRAADVGPDRVPVLIDLDKDDLAALRTEVSDLVSDEPDVDLDEEVRLHAGSLIAMAARRP